MTGTGVTQLSDTKVNFLTLDSITRRLLISSLSGKALRMLVDITRLAERFSIAFIKA